MNLVTIDNKLLFKKKNLLLGSWCVDNIYKHNNNKKIFVNLSYHWEIKSKRNKDYKYLFKLYNCFLKKLSKELNVCHGLNYSLRAWEVILFKWLWTYLVFVFDRWEQIKKASNNRKLTTKIIVYKSKDFIPYDSYQFPSLMVYSLEWNHWVSSKIIIFLKKIKYKFLRNSSFNRKAFIKKKLCNNNKNYLYLTNIFSSKKLYLQAAYFPKKILIKILIYFKQLRFKKVEYFNNNSNYDIRLRKKLFFLNSKDKFANFAFSFMKYNIPKTFIEDFNEILNILNSSYLPKNPKNILTSIEHNYNDLFKIYTAEKIMQGSKLLIMQHGGAYGIINNNWFEKLEIRISDKFLTWGWKGYNKKIIPLFLQKTLGIKIKKNYLSEGMLLPVDNFNLQPQSTSEGIPKYKEEIDSYIKSISTFLLNVDKSILDKSFLKYLNHSNIKENNYTLNSLKFKFPNIKLGSLPENIFTLSKKYKLVVESLNSTSFLELLNLNIPVILIYNDTFSSIRKSALKEFKMLEKVNIIHSSPIKAAKFVNNNYYMIEKWWNNKVLQKNRKIFCNKFAKKSENFLEELNKVF
jgi:putative transferase (TIGR04331 family)